MMGINGNKSIIRELIEVIRKFRVINRLNITKYKVGSLKTGKLEVVIESVIEIIRK